ncbi:hypothetical protein H9P43_004301 [Blastocladiella emersonii ATCC 22665]|nr:hypothetical protein H9P43_004301 [Blastocladiella emersonii ATCC 22665]
MHPPSPASLPPRHPRTCATASPAALEPVAQSPAASPPMSATPSRGPRTAARTRSVTITADPARDAAPASATSPLPPVPEPRRGRTMTRRSLRRPRPAESAALGEIEDALAARSTWLPQDPAADAAASPTVVASTSSKSPDTEREAGRRTSAAVDENAVGLSLSAYLSLRDAGLLGVAAASQPNSAHALHAAVAALPPAELAAAAAPGLGPARMASVHRRRSRSRTATGNDLQPLIVPPPLPPLPDGAAAATAPGSAARGGPPSPSSAVDSGVAIVSPTLPSPSRPLDTPLLSPTRDGQFFPVPRIRRAKSRKASVVRTLTLGTPPGCEIESPMPGGDFGGVLPLGAFATGDAIAAGLAQPPPPVHVSLLRRRLTELDFALVCPTPSPRAFAALQTLDLSRNKLTKLPAALAELTQLRSLNLACNQLTTVPRVVTAFEYLETLILSQNRIDSPIPSSLGYLTQLRVLKLDANSFCGPVPLALASLARLRTLALGSSTYGGNRITAIPPGVLGAMPELVELDLANNELMALPDDTFTSPHLRTLTVEGNRLDTLPETIADAPHLVTVLAANNLFCRLPTALPRCPRLQVLDLSGNALCFVPMELIQAVHRRRVTVLLTGNPFTRFQEEAAALAAATAAVGLAGPVQDGPSDDGDDEAPLTDQSTSAGSDDGADDDPLPPPPRAFEFSPRELGYLHPEAVAFDVQTNAYLGFPADAPACWWPPADGQTQPSQSPTPPSSSGSPSPARHTSPDSAGAAHPARVLTLRELAARKYVETHLSSRDSSGYHHHHPQVEDYVPERLAALLRAAHDPCPRCASPVVGEYLATVELERALGHTLVPVHKRYCSAHCLLQAPAVAERPAASSGLPRSASVAALAGEAASAAQIRRQGSAAGYHCLW